MSSHREAPEIAKDPVADSTDLYAFVSPDRPDTVTLIANYIPLQAPAGGPNFYEFGDGVRYEIHVDNDGDGEPDVTYRFHFHTKLRNPDTFLYNTGPIKSLDSPNWNLRQFYSVHKIDDDGEETRLAAGLACPPCNIGPLSTPSYGKLAAAAVHSLSGGVKVFAGQRAEGFYVDLGAIFDLGNLRPFEQLHNQYGMNVFTKPAPGVNATKQLNVHSIALQVPTSDLVRSSSHPVIGVWTTASRQHVAMHEANGTMVDVGPFVQVSRLGNPLFNEVIVPMGKKDLWNALPPADDGLFLQNVQHPELAALLPVLYPGAFPNLANLNAARADLVAILLTGLPLGIVPGFQNFTGSHYADELRLNMAIPPTPAGKVNELGLVAGDAAGFPNGRRAFDDIVTIELRAIAGLTYPLVNSSYKVDAAVNAVTDGLTSASTKYLTSFPYLGTPQGGYQTA